MKTLRPEQVVEALGVIASLQGDTNKANFLAGWAKEDKLPDRIKEERGHLSQKEVLDDFTNNSQDRRNMREAISRAKKGAKPPSPTKQKVLAAVFAYVKGSGKFPETGDLNYEAGSSEYVTASTVLDEIKDLAGIQK